MELELAGIVVKHVEVGKALISYDEDIWDFDKINGVLQPEGFELSKSQEEQLVDKIKRTIIDLIYHMNNMNSIVQKADYLVEMLDMSYQQIAKVFRKYEPITLEKYIILVKIEKIKELLEHENYTLSEIAYMMDYSSVQYLSGQFKKITGITVSEYKTHPDKKRIPLEKITSQQNI